MVNETMRTCIIIIIIIIMMRTTQCVCTIDSYAYLYACECIRNKHKIKSRNVDILQISSFINRDQKGERSRKRERSTVK